MYVNTYMLMYVPTYIRAATLQLVGYVARTHYMLCLCACRVRCGIDAT